MPDFFIRLATESDLPLIHALQKTAHDYPWSYENLSATFRPNSWAWLLSTQEGDFPIGYAIARFTVDAYELLDIGIHPAHRGKRYGTRLLNHVIHECLNNHADLTLPWFLEVRASNKIAQKLYASLGFVEVTTRCDYYRSQKGKEDAIVLARATHLSHIV